MSRKLINVVTGRNISDNIPKITIGQLPEGASSINLMNETIALQTLGMPLADFF